VVEAGGRDFLNLILNLKNFFRALNLALLFYDITCCPLEIWREPLGDHMVHFVNHCSNPFAEGGWSSGLPPAIP
jgi:hypothetical protein